MLEPVVVGDAQEGFDLGLILTAFAFGLRHGIDWDHIAAIADITSSQVDRKSIRLATLYVVGHALVVLILGLVAIELGTVLPAGVDSILERVVGVTLVVLGAYVFYALLRYRRDFRMRSRWMLLFSGTRRLVRFVRSRRRVFNTPEVIEHEHEHEHANPLHAAHDHDRLPERSGAVVTKVRSHRHRHRHVGSMPDDPFTEYGPATSLAVGMIHGVGAETPTQLLVFLVAVQAGGRVAGATLLAAFVGGLVASNTLIALASTFGFLRAARNFFVYASVAVLVGCFSLVVGLLFLFGRGSVMPVIFGG
jgi:ABC-type nickel/cobalt efflux system permease component RcnA